MRCLKEKELILFYYRELKEGRHKQLAEHLRECPRCLKKYKNIESVFSQIESKPLQLTPQELDSIVENVKARLGKLSFRERVKDRIYEFLQNLRLGLFYKPQLVPVMVALIIILGGLAVVRSRQHFLNREFDILEIEIELSLDDVEGSIFELYEGDLEFNDEVLGLQSPILGSKSILASNLEESFFIEDLLNLEHPTLHRYVLAAHTGTSRAG